MPEALAASDPASALPPGAFQRNTPWSERVWSGLLWGVMTLFLVNIALMIAAVATNSFARRWLGTWLPQGWTTNWYVDAKCPPPPWRRSCWPSSWKAAWKGTGVTAYP